jgi:hypothetical protein
MSPMRRTHSLPLSLFAVAFGAATFATVPAARAHETGAPHAAPTVRAAQVNAPRIREVSVIGPRILLSDLLPDVAGADAVDLGAVPSSGGSRLFEQRELVVALKEHELLAPKKLPDGVRVLRKMRTLSRAELEAATRTAGNAGLPRGVTLSTIRPPASVAVPDGWTSVRLEMGKPPRRTGAWSTSAMLVFAKDTEALARIAVTLDVTLGADAAVPDMAHGSTVTLIIRTGPVEVSTTALVGADGDVGAVVPVTVKSSGRPLRARVLDHDHVLLEEGI